MNRKFLIGLLSYLLAANALFASAFDDANEQFKAGDFSGAAGAYEKILAAEGSRA